MIAERLAAVRTELGDRAELVAVSKTHPADAIQQAYTAGQRDFGESYGQELRDKAPVLPDDIRWHFIGRLQKNKLKYVAPHAFRVHGITHVEQAEGLARRRPGIAGMINVDLGDEASKVGVPVSQALALAEAVNAVDGFALVGLMCIPPFTEDPADAGPYFQQLADLAASGRARGLPLDELSMGMSRDWHHALAHAGDCRLWVRVGTAIFGPRG